MYPVRPQLKGQYLYWNIVKSSIRLLCRRQRKDRLHSNHSCHRRKYDLQRTYRSKLILFYFTIVVNSVGNVSVRLKIEDSLQNGHHTEESERFWQFCGGETAI